TLIEDRSNPDSGSDAKGRLRPCSATRRRLLVYKSFRCSAVAQGRNRNCRFRCADEFATAALRSASGRLKSAQKSADGAGFSCHSLISTQTVKGLGKIDANRDTYSICAVTGRVFSGAAR